MWKKQVDGSWKSQTFSQLLHLRILRFRFFQDGDVGVGILPEGEEVLVIGSQPSRVSPVRKCEL